MKIKNGHLTYCTNIHQGENWKDHFQALKQHFPLIKKQVSPSSPMGIGLRLSNIASLELIEQGNLDTFKNWLNNEQAYVFTINGFPYGEFHHTKVKENVHSPDWTTKNRLDYTIRLFNILKELLPPGMDGGVSTSPLSYRHWFTTEDDLKQATENATHNILSVAAHLIEIRNKTGIILHLDLEPEPDGILETGQEFIDWYEQVLLPKGKRMLSDRFSVDLIEAENLLKDHIRLCYDVCHFALGYENHADILHQLFSKNINVGKIQISAALKATLTSNIPERSKIIKAFSAFNEPVYLHQVIAKKNNHSLLRYKDLPHALLDSENPDVEEWRAHFHVPVFLEDFGYLQSTQNDILELLSLHSNKAISNHLEVETYTWEILPENLKLPIQESIIRELKWVKSYLDK